MKKPKGLRICFCIQSIEWIGRHLKKSARAQFKKMVSNNFPRTKEKLFKKPRSRKQQAATRKLVAFNKRRRRR